ncbi:alkaline phytoceramidase [Dichomitus squalens LYAD-421 SS1]|uniref:alkaline phytoceramidase n=1 Tax=Dichomitus squalens (strain LYAD-421) TaxID=732165 RepID=UPI0004411FB3|nr:alkaline phytoceramidase [Dichomitus squalens LYAD-421 SS1]EJF67253.1 alkaline phytoceramidase [Dichomitus squalens LYAD-421 SS1]
MALNTTTNALLAGQAFWGPVTATLDWCEVNYQFSRYIAEVANSFSNLFTIGLAVYGAAQSVTEKLPPRYLVGYAGFALVGIGSFMFHATLLFEAQLMDELPMIYVASYCCAVLFDTSRGFDLRQSNAGQLGVIFMVFNVLFTWSYYTNRNPIYHQAVFAVLMLTTTFRTAYLLRHGEISKRLHQAQRSTIARMFGSGAATFAFGFLIWNLDNVFCSHITRWKQSVGWPAAFLLEGHSWWHVLTAIGTYLMLIGNTYRTLCIKDDPNNYTVTKVHGLPRIQRTDGAKKQ